MLALPAAAKKPKVAVLDLQAQGVPGETAAHYGTDFLDTEQFGGLLEDALARAREIVAGIRGGRIARRPRGGSCPSWCGFAPICRRERGAVEPEEEEEQ